MKLAEALLLRADLQKKLGSLQTRAQKYTVVQEGERPAEDPNEVLREVSAVAGQLHRLVFAINATNLRHTVASGETITEALARRDSLTLQHRVLVGVVDSCAKPVERYGVKEIRWVVTVDVPTLHRQIDETAKQIRELNAAIQEVGWRVEIAEH
ncbi:MAG TPA: DIP1984 family protein [Gemmata sp.]